jgi:hypothetical protein
MQPPIPVPRQLCRQCLHNCDLLGWFAALTLVAPRRAPRPQPPYTPAARLLRTPAAPSPRPRAEPLAQLLSVEQPLERLVVQREVRHHMLQPAVLVLQLFKSPGLRDLSPPYFAYHR